MTKLQYDSLTPSEKIFAELLLEIAKDLRALRDDITRDITETLK
jgi:hypothetical protein